ncbi:MAG: O-antigen ligase family protein [Alphaproteobacteria bacterium]|nr:O-antigen ligase family protein [Alphaproteobacteria bacterium]
MTAASERIAGLRIWGAAVLVAALGLVLPLAANGTVVLLLLLGLITMTITGTRRAIAAAPFELVLGIVVLAAWTVLSSFWSPLNDPGKALRTVGLFVPGLALVGWTLFAQNVSERFRRAVLLAMALALFVFLFEGVSGAGLTRLVRGDDPASAATNLERVGRGVVLFAALLWPASVALAARHRIVGVVFFASGAAAVALLPMNAALVGLLLGAITFLAVRIAPRTALAGLVVAFTLYAAFAPWLSRDVVNLQTFQSRQIVLPSAWAHRIGIWTFAAEQATNAAPLGAGFDASRAIGAREDVIEALRPQFGYAPAALPLHPHNALLQIWLELGVVGVIAIILIFAGLIRALRRWPLPPWHRAAGAAAVVAVLPPFVLNFGVWQAWWIASLWIGVTLTAGLLRADDNNGA